jgi:hypothetical protein
MRAALGAHCIVHLTRLPTAASAAITLALAGVAAVFAAHGLVRKALFGKEFLFARGENEILAAVPASQRFVLVHWLFPRFDLLLSEELWPNRMPHFYRPVYTQVFPALFQGTILGLSPNSLRRIN